MKAAIILLGADSGQQGHPGEVVIAEGIRSR
jgi:hypothetical protein